MRKRRRVSRSRRGDVAAIRGLAARWREGWIAGDAEALLSLYADRPVLMPQGRPAIHGKAAIRPLYRAALRGINIVSKGRLREVEASGDWGYFWSTYSITATPKSGGAPVRSKGKSVFIVRRQCDGSWKIARLIDNSDA